MQAKTKERWQQLCQLAIDERDPRKFAAISDELSRLLQEKSSRLMTGHTTLPVCWICGKTVALETCKVDEYGKAVHEACYESKIAFEKVNFPVPE